MRRGIYRTLVTAFGGAGVRWEDCYHEDRGDGVMVLVPTKHKSVLASRLPGLVATALAQHNRDHDQQTQIRLRMVLHAGEIQADEHGVTGNALILAFRLLDAEPLKRALDGSSGFLAMITSEWFYDEVIVNTPACAPATYRRVFVSVKNTQEFAWICRPDDPYPPRQDSEQSAAPNSVPPSALGPLPIATASVGTGRIINTFSPGLISSRPDPTRPVQDPRQSQRRAGPTLARKALGARLRRLRVERGMSRADAASAIGGSESKIRRIEIGQVSCKQPDIYYLLNLYGIIDVTVLADSLTLAHETGTYGWMHAYRDMLSGNLQECLELEQDAILIRGYEPHVIPRLLQTPDYTRAMLRHNPDIPRSHTDRWVDLLTNCQRIFQPPEPTRLWMIFDEEALHPSPGVDTPTMRHQLHHLIHLARQTHIRLQLLPVGTTVTAGDTFTILRLPTPELHHVVCLGRLAKIIHLHTPENIEHYQKVMDRLIVRATEPQETITILRNMLKAI